MKPARQKVSSFWKMCEVTRIGAVWQLTLSLEKTQAQQQDVRCLDEETI